MMAAGRAAEMGAEVALFEKTDGPGKKLLITGNTRCNITNMKEPAPFMDMFGRNGHFLHGAFRTFFREELLALLRRYGVETVVEPGGRVFPSSGRAGDVLGALKRYMSDQGAALSAGMKVSEIVVEAGRVSGVRVEGALWEARAIVVATGGASYPRTGSTGDGYGIAAKLGHTIVPLRPSLVPLVVRDKARAMSMQGVSLRDVRLTAYQCGAEEVDLSVAVARDYGRGVGPARPPRTVIESRRGDVMMTHFGLGGPTTLLISLAIVDALTKGPVCVSIDLFPDMNSRQMDAKLQQEFDRHGKRTYRNILEALLPHKMVGPIAATTGIDWERPANQINAGERQSLLRSVKNLRFDVEGPLSMEAAFVTAGGVSLKDVDPRTMGSRLVDGLYFAGEVLDLDADTGGYNLQAAFSTGYVAGEHAALGCLESSSPGLP